MHITKNSKLVTFPLENICLNEVSSECTPAPAYNLRAVSNHFGSVGGGHYTAYVKHDVHGWLEFDDSSVSKISENKVCSSSAYVLFLERTD